MALIEMEATRVLVVDDSAHLRHTLRDSLDAGGMECAMADSGEAALALCQERTFDIVLMDVNMPGMNGLEAVSQIRKLSHMLTIPVFIVSSDTSEDLRKQGKRVGVTAWIRKPYNPEMVIKGIQQVLNGPAMPSLWPPRAS